MSIHRRRLALCAVLILISVVFFRPDALSQEPPAPRYNQVFLQANAERPVDNDLMQAVLRVEREDRKAAALADAVNEAMSWALARVKARGGLEVVAGAYETYPVYKEQRLSHWRARQDLVLQGTDRARMLDLIGTLQERVQLASVNFTVSPDKRREIENALIEQALEVFKQRAAIVQRTLGAQSYRIVQLQIGRTPVPVHHPMARSAMAAEAAVAAPAMESGRTEMTVEVSGTIELQ